jgi:uncharacterized protein (UPF0264 family)
MTKLLVSVRDAAEAQVALDAGVDLIDIKEPRHGALGAATPTTIENIAGSVARRAPLSIALGELADWTPSALPGPAALASIRFAKLGLAGMAADPAWESRWQAAWSSLPVTIGRVAVVYADWRSAQSPSPNEILTAAKFHSCAAVLVDTFDKSAGSLIDHWSLDEIANFIDHVRQARMICVVAGSLTRHTVASIAALEPDYVAVRGAACTGGRDGPVSAACIYNLRRAIRRAAPVLRAMGENA